MSQVIDDSELKELLVNPKKNRTGQYVCDCPFCGKEGHFYINIKTQMWDCKKCGEYGNIYKLLSHLGKTYLLGGKTIKEDDRISSIKSLLEERTEEKTDDTELPTIKMPAGWRVSKKSTDYLLSRGVTAQDCIRYNIGATDLVHKFRNYVLVPIYDDGVVKGYIGRYGAKKVPEDKLRYNNSIGTEFAKLLFGYDDIVQYKTYTVILVEGIFDKISVDKVLRLDDDESVKCVCTFGKKISTTQLEKLKTKGVRNVILLYDFDAIKEIKKYGLLLEQSFVTNIVYTTKKDIDECTQEEALAVFENPQRPSEFNVNVIGKLKR